MPRLERWRGRLPDALWLLPPLLALLPHLHDLPPWLGLACLAAWSWRLALALADKPLPPKFLRVLLALTALLGVFWQFHSIVGQQAGVPLFILLLFIKLLESASLAEKRLLLILTQFAAMSYFLTGQSLPVTTYLLGVSVLGVAVMVHLQGGGALDLRPALQRALILFAGGLPLALMLFVFFPRLDRPLWSLPTHASSAGTGLSDNMGPGDISNLIQSGEIAFRAQFRGVQPDPNGLYWRGPVLTDFDGRVWHALSTRQPFQGRLVSRGTSWQMTLTLEPHQRRWLFSPGLPDPLPEETALAEGMQWLAREPVTQRKRWSARVYPDYLHVDDAAELDRSLALPENFNPRSRALAQGWRGADSRPEALVQRALDLYGEAFTYTLRPPLLGTHSVDEFLFGTKRGFCEHFASSFVFLMRAAGVPARVVTGYLGGEVNPLDGHVVVRQSDAHAWAEVWLGRERGWTRVDPTAAVSPLRVERGIGAALPEAELPPTLARLSLPWLQGVRHTWESLNNGWNEWVLGYGQDQQLQLLSRLSPALASVRWLASATILMGALGLALLFWFYWREPRRQRQDRAAQAWQGLERRLARLGLPPRLGEAPLEYVQRVAAARPDLAQTLTEIARLYLSVRYGSAAHQLPRLMERVSGFRPARQA